MSKKNKPVTTAALDSTACAAFEDGIRDFYMSALGARVNADGSKTPEANLVDTTQGMLLRVGALTSKTKVGAPVAGKAEVIAEPFETVDESIPTATLYTILNFRNHIDDFYKVALIALVSGIAYAKTKQSVAGDDKAKPKRNGNALQNAAFASLGIERVKDAEGVWSYTVKEESPAAGMIAEATRTVPKFPAEALNFMGKAPALPKSATIVLNLAGKTFTLIQNSGPSDTVSLVGGFQSSGIEVTRVSYKDESKLQAALKIAPEGIVHLFYLFGEDKPAVDRHLVGQPGEENVEAVA